METFSRQTKDAILDMQPKNKCCNRMLDIGMAYLDFDDENPRESVASAVSHAKCPSCLGAYIAGLFASVGSVTDPDKSYHLDFTFDDGNDADTLLEILTENGINAKLGERKNKSIVYLKESGAIEDFLALIGANSAAFTVMNSKIVRELRGNANRVVNCDTANIKKTLAASQKYLDVIAELAESGNIDKLPADLRETAELRAKFEQLTIGELGEKHEKKISKSGVKHRLDRIVSFYEEMKRQEN